MTLRLRRTPAIVYGLTRRLLSEALIDRPLDLETSRQVQLKELGLDDRDRTDYEPSGWMTLRRVLPPDEVSPDDVFIDLGSGKGRVVLQAARYRFRRVIGVELSESLNDIARHNLDLNRQRLSCPSIELITADVTAFQIPDDVTVAYLYNPFRGDAFKASIDNLLRSLERRPRGLRVIYRSPFEEQYLRSTGRFVLQRSIRGVKPWSARSSTRLYAVTPA